jgi:diguanylate cyclase (GGDEF)-like protein/PAS domain S-box-containing protein
LTRARLIGLLSALHEPRRRADAVHALATEYGLSEVKIFGKDGIVSSLLPALGLPQTLRQSRFWNKFVAACLAQPECLYTQISEAGSIEGIADIHGNCVLVGHGHFPPEDIQLISLLLRPLGLKLVEERRLQGLQIDIRAARKIVQHADALNKTIDISRTQLHDAYQRAEKELAQRRLAEENLSGAIELSQTIMQYSIDVIALFDQDGRVLQTSQAVTSIWGYQPNEIIGRKIFDFILPEDRQRSFAAMQSLAPDQPVRNFENRYRHKDGDIVYMLWNASSFGGQGHFIALGRDITALKQASMRLEESEQRFRSLFDHHSDAVLARDLEGRFIEGNRALLRLTQYSAAELQQLDTRTLVAAEEKQRNQTHFQQAVKGIPQNFRTQLQRKDGTSIEIDLAYVPTIVKQKVVGVFGLMRDITEAANYERHIAYLASHDTLTGLPNRNLLDDRLRHAIEKRHAQQFGILFMDLNRFKIVNDSLGHDKGDLLLQMTAERLRKAVREGDTVARLGGDEFVVMLEDIDSSDRVAQVANELLAVVAEPFQLGGHELTISTSIGGSVYPKDGTDAVTLLKHADLAMYQAKELGAGTFRFFNPAMNVKMLERLLTESSLKRALERNEFVLHYQPIIDAQLGSPVGVEALVRWIHPERGLIAPEDFIPLAEEIGVICDLGEWVLETACRQNRIWQKQGLVPLKMSVNLSAQQLAQAEFTAILQRVLDATELDPRWLGLEITETSLMQNIDISLVTLQEIRDIGISISIDDFGTGYSSLAYLKKLPIHTLKIDKSFIHDVILDPDDAAIVTATIALAHNMGLQVVAEGVMTASQMRFLMDRHCNTMQGYLFSRPVPATELPAHLEACSQRLSIEREEWLLS